MAQGYNYNTNLASEFYVMSVLYRLGLEAHLTLGNKKAVDIVVVRAPGGTVTIDVKAVVGKTDWLAGNAASVPRANHFVVLLTYEGKFSQIMENPRAWVFPHEEFIGLVKSAQPPSTMKYVPRSQVLKLTRWESAWDLLNG